MEKASKPLRYLIGAAVIVAVIAVAYLKRDLFFPIPGANPDKLTVFADCLKQRGALFYGAFWCPHCQNQKALFQGAASHLPYIECSTPDGQGQLSVCTDNKIMGYPTWVFSDGTRISGETSLADLSAKTGCTLSQ